MAEMIDIFLRMEERLTQNPDKVVLSDGGVGSDVTRKELEMLSGKTYRFLKEKGIGKEKKVTILLPRGTNGPSALLGVWKAGACAVLLENNMPAEREKFILKDCDSSIVIDEKTWDEILKTEPLSGHESFELHAAAYIVYTSGTSGKPKGVLHEYGSIPLLYASCRWEGKPMFVEDDIFALISPLNFVASIMSIIYSFFEGTKLLIVPNEIIRNLQNLMDYFVANKASVTFFPASLFRMIPSFGPYLKKIFISSEPANGIWKPKEEMTIWNIYCSSESGTIVSVTRLDAPNEIASIGNPQYDIKLFICDESGNPVENGKTGELCYEVPYTRGYIGESISGNKVFEDRIFHSGDLARRLENGEYQLIGRLTDTIKINGNRVEPAEVESAIKKVAGLKWTAIRGFVDETRSFLCAYYIEDTNIDVKTLREKMSAVLPWYMIPTYFIKINDVPRNKNGKLDRERLPKPKIDEYQAVYEEPGNKTEKILCCTMAKVLKKETISAEDDFYLLGGDSLLSMMLLVESGLPGLDLDDIYIGRTPKEIAKRYNNKKNEDDYDKNNRISMERPHPLSSEQKYIYSYQQYTPDSTMYNLYVLVRLGVKVTAEEFSIALGHAIRNHPALMTELYKDENGEIMQHYVPDDMPEILVEYITEKQLELIKGSLVKPFDLRNKFMWRYRIFSTESGLYFFFDVHHIIFDGYSVQLFFKDLNYSLSGKELPTDYYYYILSNREKKVETSEYIKAREYFRARYSDKDIIKNLPYAEIDNSNKSDSVTIPISFSQKQLEAFKKKSGMGMNGLFITAALLALSKFTGADKVMVTWAFNGRNSVQSQNSIGALYHVLPVALMSGSDMTCEDIFRDIRTQIEKGIENSIYSYIRTEFSKPVEDDRICVLFQGDMHRFDTDKEIVMEEIELTSDHAAAQNSLDVEIINSSQGCLLYLDYAASRYEKETILRFGNLIRDITNDILTQTDKEDRL